MLSLCENGGSSRPRPASCPSRQRWQACWPCRPVRSGRANPAMNPAVDGARPHPVN